tara:strand:+ start:649 stop:846 length:198 start_codon:yes stop_codon:yes gene_type:complete
MPNVGRAKGINMMKNKKSNTGTGSVVNYSGFMGRGIVIRKRIISRAVCSTGGNCYTSIQMQPRKL